jgi:hypothetical protein
MEQARTLKNRFYVMFAEMKTMLSQNIHPAGRSTVAHALDAFGSRWSRADVFESGNHSKVLDELSSHAARLMETIRGASSERLTDAGQIARQVSSTLQSLKQETQRKNDFVDSYRRSAREVKKRQEKLSRVSGSGVDLHRAILQEGANTFLLEFDRSWWTVREKLDAYFDAAENENVALGSAIEVIDGYVSRCTKNAHELGLAQTQAIRAEDVALAQLRDSWFTVKHELGLLVSKIRDGHIFLQLGRADVFAVDWDANRSEFCSGNARAIEVAMEETLNEGLAVQIWNQLQGILSDADGLHQKFASHKLAESVTNEDDLHQRAFAAFDELTEATPSMALELAVQICRPQINLETASAYETNVQAMTANVMKVHSQETKLREKIAMLKDLIAKLR